MEFQTCAQLEAVVSNTSLSLQVSVFGGLLLMLMVQINILDSLILDPAR